jgi:mono/diheme cytochrome c family protein
MIDSMKKIKISLTLVFGFCGLALLAQSPSKQIKQVPIKPIASVEGKDLFRQYCAVCHGEDARGGGPAAAALTKSPGDLTLLAKRNGGTYPEVRVLRSINGEVGVVAHGTRDMPVWGPLFKHMSSNEDLGTIRVYNLVKYIQSLQQK